MRVFNSQWKQKISRRRSRSPDFAELDNFTFFRRERQRNVQRFITHVHSHCFAQPLVLGRSRCGRRRGLLGPRPH